MRKNIWLIMVLLFSATSQGKDLSIAVGLSIPPYVIQDTHSGFEMELIEEVFKLKNHRIKNIVYASSKRITKLLKKQRVDVGINILPHLKNVHYSDSIVEFVNYAIALKSRDITIKSVFDLYEKRVEGFQNAHKFLGQEFNQYAHNNPFYEEMLHQESQVIHLLNKKIDVVVADKNIFLYYAKKRYGQKYQEKDFNFSKIFINAPRFAGFVDAALQQDFNEALRAFKKTPKYQHLLQKYKLTQNSKGG